MNKHKNNSIFAKAALNQPLCFEEITKSGNCLLSMSVVYLWYWLPLILLFFFVSLRCCSPGEVSDWSIGDSTETVHAQPDNTTRRLRTEYHQRSRLRLRVLVLRGWWQFLSRVLRHPSSTLHTLVLFQCTDQCQGFNVMFDYFWQFLRWKATSCFWWERYTLFRWQAQPEVHSCIASGIMELTMEKLYVIITSLKKWDIQKVF